MKCVERYVDVWSGMKCVVVLRCGELVKRGGGVVCGVV
jgi:hypothetical protein